MFNVVGCMNYRYFFMFLSYVIVTCVYGLLLTAQPFLGFLNHDRELGRRIGNVGSAGFFSKRSATTYTFILALSIGIAVGLLFFWHLYLVLSAQTTIEFYGNQTKAYRARYVLRGCDSSLVFFLGGGEPGRRRLFVSRVLFLPLCFFV